MRISDWSSDVCSSDLPAPAARGGDDAVEQVERRGLRVTRAELTHDPFGMNVDPHFGRDARGEIVEIEAGELLSIGSIESARLHHRITEHHRDAERLWCGVGPRSEEHPSELQSLMRI